MVTVKIMEYSWETCDTTTAATVVLDGAGWTSEGALALWCDDVLKAVNDTRDPESALERALHTEFHAMTLYAVTEPGPWKAALEALLEESDLS